jgi:hypothetical protein
MTEPSKAAIDMIVAFEVTSEAVYRKKYQHPEWPGGASGVTIGIGYDVGYVTITTLKRDWAGAIPDTIIEALRPAVGVKGPPAKALALELADDVTVPWEPAIAVFARAILPRYSRQTRAALPNTDMLSGDSFGALVSLTFNRGASFAKPGERYKEMRAIKSHMGSRNFAAIPDELRAMQRIWPNVAGLQRRRREEARLFEKGLA